MKLLTLHMDLLLCLFNNYFSLHEQFHLRSICRQLCRLLESSHCIGRVGSLKLFWSFRDIERYTSDLFYTGLEEIPELNLSDIGSTDDDLVLNAATFCAATCELLVRLFPQVRHLVIYFTFAESYPDYLLMTELLNQWQGSLVGLSLFGVFRHGSIAPDATQEQNSWARMTFCEAIDQLGALKHFDLDLDNLFDNNYGIRKKLEATEFWLPARLAHILPNLERLYFSGLSKDFEQNVLRHLGSACTWLALVRHSLEQDELRTALNTTCAKHAQMRFTTIRLFDELDLLSEDFCCETVESLSLSQNFHLPLQPIQVLDKLAQLKRLHKLNLALFDLNCLIDNSSSTSSVRLGVSTLPRISNLSILLARSSDPVTLFSTILPHVFPSVLSFTLHIPIIVMERDFVFSGLPQPLHPSSVISFRHCTKFRLFLTETNNYEGTFTGLLSMQHRERFQREKINGHLYDTMQQWKHSSSGQWVEVGH